MPNYAYQLIFADPATTKKVEDHVRPFSLPHPVTSLTVSEHQIEVFYRAVFAAADTNIDPIGSLARIHNGEVDVDPSAIKTILSDEVSPAQINRFWVRRVKPLTGTEILHRPKWLLSWPTKLLPNHQNSLR